MPPKKVDRLRPGDRVTVTREVARVVFGPDAIDVEWVDGGSTRFAVDGDPALPDVTDAPPRRPPVPPAR